MSSTGDKLKNFLSGGGKKRRATDHALEDTRSPSSSHCPVNKSKSVDAATFESCPEQENGWKDLELIKTMAPVIMCVLPSTAKEFVASVLLAIGAYPLMPEEIEDVECQLAAAEAVLVDTSAKRDIVEAVIEHYVGATAPLILVCWESGTNDARKALTRKVAEICKPTVISGRLGDVHALSLDVMDRAGGMIDATEDEESEGKPKEVVQRTKSKSPEEKLTPSTPQGGASPRFMRKKSSDRVYQRQQTAIPQMTLKGRFRHRSIKNASIPDALKSAQKLAAQLGCYVHLYETNVITCGEFFYEINNSQLGMEKLHHTVQCAASIIATTVACVDQDDEEMNLHTCGHALCLYHVAAEEAAAKVLIDDKVLPGSLKVAFIDELHKLDEATVRSKAQIVFHNSPPAH